MRSRLTIRRLRAIIESLIARTAGEIDLVDDPEHLTPEDYDAALRWALEEEYRRRRAK